jgi:hypothetical protein
VRFRCEFSTNALSKLERLTQNLRTGRFTDRGAYLSVSAIDSVLVDLGRQVVDNDDLGASVGSEEELVFRAARLIVETQLGRIEQAIRAVLGSHSPDAVCTDAWDRLLEAMLEAIPLARKELRRITRAWRLHRYAGAEAIDAVRTAISELRAMAEVPEVKRLLGRGWLSTRWPEIAAACGQILVALHVHVDLEGARMLWDARGGFADASSSAPLVSGASSKFEQTADFDEGAARRPCESPWQGVHISGHLAPYPITRVPHSQL